ncbi:MAG TPA: hypothetical protein VMW69_12095 [Spirochaetia bacterium]|nr:hypothetical protein [Spirochaetia bacterium]
MKINDDSEMNMSVFDRLNQNHDYLVENGFADSFGYLRVYHNERLRIAFAQWLLADCPLSFFKKIVETQSSPEWRIFPSFDQELADRLEAYDSDPDAQNS